MRIAKHLSPCELVVEKIFSVDEIRSIEEQLLKQKGKELTVPGFRKGFAPLEKIREIVPKNTDWEENFSMALQKKFLADWEDSFGKDQGSIVKIISIDTVKQNPLILSIKCEYLPVFELKSNNFNYKKLKIEKGADPKNIKVADQEVEAALKEIQKRRAVLKPTSSPLGKNIHAFIKVTHDKLTGKDLFQWGKEQFGVEFDNKTKGLGEGAEKKIRISLKKGVERMKNILKEEKIAPEEEITLSVKIEKTFIFDVPELNDEFAKSLGKFQNLTELKQSLRQGLRLEKIYREKDSRKEKLIDSLIKEIDLNIPPSLVERNAKKIAEDFDIQTAQRFGIPQQEFQEKRNKEEKAKLGKFFLKKSERELKLQKILEAIAIREKIIPEEAEVDKEIQKILTAFASPRDARKALGDPKNLKERITLALCLEKTMEFLARENQLSNDLDSEIKKLTPCFYSQTKLDSN